MRIAILGWGSLVWDPRELKIRKRWYRRGPELPIEFSRISGGGRVTLVIDPANGHLVRARFAFSTCATVAEAVQNLQEREGCPLRKIGSATVGEKLNEASFAMQQHPKQCRLIYDWAAKNKMDAVVWTALESNFSEPEKAGIPFTPEAAATYIAGLKDDALKGALHYIGKAPAEVVTPVRMRVTRWCATQKIS